MERSLEVALRRSYRLLAPSVLLAMVLLSSACAGRRHTPATEPTGATMGVYRATLDTPSGKSRRFRVLLYATLPDRLHAEIVSPLGTTEAIVDGGAGRLAVTVPRQRVTYVGVADDEALGKVLGIPVSLGTLVGVLLGEQERVAELAVARRPRRGPGLPDGLELRGGGSRLELRLKKKRPLRVSTATLGNGEPPPGTDLLALEELERSDLEQDDGG